MRAASSTFSAVIAPSAVSCASSTMFSAVRASPPERCAISSTTSSDAVPPTSARPRRTTTAISSGVSDSSSYTCVREMSAELTS